LMFSEVRVCRVRGRALIAFVLASVVGVMGASAQELLDLSGQSSFGSRSFVGNPASGMAPVPTLPQFDAKGPQSRQPSAEPAAPQGATTDSTSKKMRRSGATPPPPAVPTPNPAVAAAAAAQLPPGYAIGPDDVLTVIVWREKDLSADVVVRPDGRITLPLVNEVQAQGLTPDALRVRLTEEFSKYVEEPNVSVIVKTIKSRQVYITGQVGKAGGYPLTGTTTVLQLIAMAGGISEFAKAKEIVITRVENGQQKVLRFNYRDVLKGKNLKQNVELKPGDTVLVP
jgi:polysaccharide export outer membrane protein